MLYNSALSVSQCESDRSGTLTERMGVSQKAFFSALTAGTVGRATIQRGPLLTPQGTEIGSGAPLGGGLSSSGPLGSLRTGSGIGGVARG